MLPASYPISKVAGIMKGALYSNRFDDPEVRDLLTDSRQVRQTDGTLFFAIITKRNDGHKYLEELFQKGIRLFVVVELPDQYESWENCCFIKVNNSVQALQTLAAYNRKAFISKVVGITGSNGKTIVKEWLFQLLSPDKKIVRSPKSYNSQIGVPLSVWQIQQDDELAIIEAGVSETEEMNKLQTIIMPDIGIFTNIGSAHDENFINRDQKVAEKLKLFTKVEVLIYCADYLDITGRIVQSEAFRKIRTLTWGKKKEADIKIVSINRSNKHTDISTRYLDVESTIRIPFIDDASLENAMHCYVLMLYLGISHESIKDRLESLSPVAMRLELKEGINNCSIINDSYSSDVNSLSIALDFLKQQKQHNRRTVILSDVLQSGRDEGDLYSHIAGLLESKGINQVIGIGPAVSRQAAKFHIEKSFFQSTEDFLKKFPLSTFHNESILIKGARIFEFEQISKLLQQKSHDTVLEINLNSLVHNLNVIRALLMPGVKTMAMVKAFSYGSGSFEVANLLQFHNVDYLAVAYADEGVELRKAGINMPILVMNPDEESIDALTKFNLEPEVYSFRILNLLKESRQKLHHDQSIPMLIHIKLDTGMHRLGFSQDEISRLIENLSRQTDFKVQSIFSHLAASSNPAFDDFTRQQLGQFREMAAQITEVLNYPVLLHILNSAGISRFPEAQLDMVRLGISLYGAQSDPENTLPLQNVSTLRSGISQVKTIKKGESISYNRSWMAQDDMTIAIVPIGYADGLSRRLGNGVGTIAVKGNLCKIVGDICMDMCMIDITGLDISEDDNVIVFGQEKSIDTLAAEMGTIAYEVLTGISRRVKRVYFQE
jgi:alanine racemase